MDKTFKYQLGDKIELLSGETGTVMGRADYVEYPTTYSIRYTNAAGALEQRWWDESAIKGAGI